MGRVTITQYGSARNHPDGTWTFPKGRPDSVTIEEGDVVGFRYRAAGRGETVTVELSLVFHDEGESAPPTYCALGVEPQVEFMRNEGPPPEFFAAGRPMRASFAARSGPRGRPDTASVRIVPASMGRIFSRSGLPPATDAAIARFETRFRTTFRSEYRAFLKDRNGVDLVWWRDPRWITGMPASADEGGGFYNDLAAREPEIRRQLKADWEGPRSIFGIENGHPDLAIAEGEDELHFYRAELMRHAYIVARDGGGNNFVQVAQGRHAGRILGVDHEVYYGGLSTFVDLEDLDEDARAELPWTDFTRATTDDVIDKALEYGFLYPIAADFTTFLAGEIAVAEALVAELAPRYRRP